MNKQYSLRLHLLLLIALPLVLTGAVVGGAALFNAYHEIEEVYDAELSHAAKLFLQLTEHELEEHKKEEIKLGIEEAVPTHPYEKNISFRIWKGEDLITQSVSASHFDDFRAPPGFSNHFLQGETWRFFVYIAEQSGITVEVAEKQEVRKDITLDLAESLLFPVSFFVPLLLFLVWFGTSRSLKPLRRLSAAVDRRDVNDLSPLHAPRIPLEIAPLFKALNRLFSRMENSIQREREFTDNAAHELRTPLAAMKTQAQVLLKKTKEREEKEGLDNLIAAIDRATRMVEQLLSFSRIQSQNMVFDDLDLSSLLHEICDEITPLARAKNQRFTSHIAPDIIVKGCHDALYVMVRNLVDNAVKFTPETGAIELSLTKTDDHLVLRVSDTGPGISGSQKEKVFERFYRVDKSKTQGSGLGLSMVKWIADAHQARIEIRDNHPTGLIVEISLSEM